MSIGNVVFDEGEIRKKFINDPQIRNGNFQIVDPTEKRVFYIKQVFGTNIEIRNKSGVAIISGLADPIFGFPLRVNEGFGISGTNAKTIFVECVVI